MLQTPQTPNSADERVIFSKYMQHFKKVMQTTLQSFGRHSNPSFRTWATSISVSQDANFLDIVLYPNSRFSVGLYSQLFTCRLQSLSQNCFKLPKKATKDRQGFGTLKLGSPRSRCCGEDHQLFPPENDQQWFVNMKHSSKLSRLFPLTFRA